MGIGTLYRNFPTRQDLFETVYVDEVEALARRAEELTGLEPWAALVAWLRQFVSYATTKRAIYEALNRDSAMFAACREIMYSAGRPLLQRAQADGQARPDVSFEDVLRLISGISGSAYSDDEQRERVLTMALDGIRHGPEADPLGRSEPCPWERVLSSTLPYREATRGGTAPRRSSPRMPWSHRTESQLPGRAIREDEPAGTAG